MRRYKLVTLLVIVALVVGCVRSLERRLVEPGQAATLDGRSPFLKVHLQNGETYVLADWSVNETTRAVRGTGRRLDTHRRVVETGSYEIPIDAAALFETNVSRTSGVITGMTVVTGISVAVTVMCAANPKACFGSCPTFYVSDGQDMQLRAEGFSASIAPSLEQTDIDALPDLVADGSNLEIHMRNEALETHVVRRVDVLAAQRPPGGHVFATSDGVFWQSPEVYAPVACTAPEGDVLQALQDIDGLERFSTTDSTDLASRETIEIEFAKVTAGDFGLVIASRQTLVTTYLLYQTLSDMGVSAGRYLAALERGDPWIRDRLQATGQSLGAIEVLVLDGNGNWVLAGQTAETGPLATDVRMVPLPTLAESASLRVRLRLARGYWRLDAVALARRGSNVVPQRLEPVHVTRDGVDEEDARARLTDPERTLVALPGDEYILTYALPDEPSMHDYFLESSGYYLEWMREEWLGAENPAHVAQLFLHPDAAMRRMAPGFKEVEADMERVFWGSRYAGPRFETLDGAHNVN